MTKLEFQSRLDSMYKENPMIARSKKKTFNEITYILRMDQSNTDYNISTVEKDGTFGCIPSVKECFIPTRTLAKHVDDIVFEDYMEDMDLVCLTILLD